MPDVRRPGAGPRVRTIEGLADDGAMNPLQEALWASHSFQCGFCTPGFVMQITALLAEKPQPDEEKIRNALSGNICRCTGYQSIVGGSAAGLRPEPCPRHPWLQETLSGADP